MIAPPSHIFVVRHGNRLDAADKKWHLTSPTPYDPPLTYSGLQQARQVGNHIGGILEQAKLEHDTKNQDNPGFKRRRFNVVIHTSPFIRCVQTSVGISSGLAQLPVDSIYNPSDIIVPPTTSPNQSNKLKTALLRIDSFLGEWLSPEYFEMITPPPGPALMLGGAKAELLRREDYSFYSFDEPPPLTTPKLWQSPKLGPTDLPPSPAEDKGSPALSVSTLFGALPSGTGPKKGYTPPRPNPPVLGASKIPEGIVAHARDSCISVDFQWDSMREPLDFGDGGQLGEEWISMHKRFRKGLRKMIDWYATTENAAQMVTSINSSGMDHSLDATDEEEVETVLILVSHGAGCNALIGAITHQPVLMDVSLASVTMAQRRSEIDKGRRRQSLAQDAESNSSLAVEDLYEIRVSATTEHLHSASSTPVSTRSVSASNIRGRTLTFSSGSGAIISPFTYNNDAFAGPTASTVSAAAEKLARRGSSQKSMRGVFSSAGNGTAIRSRSSRSNSSSSLGTSEARTSSPARTSLGLWAPARSSLRLMDDNSDDDSDSFDMVLPNFGTFGSSVSAEETKPTRQDLPSSSQALAASTTSGGPVQAPGFVGRLTALDSSLASGTPMLAGPIRLETRLNVDALGLTREEEEEEEEDVFVSTTSGDGLGGLWGRPTPPSDAEKFRDLSRTKRRWTVNERVI